jgi:hypothetical protein
MALVRRYLDSRQYEEVSIGRRHHRLNRVHGVVISDCHDGKTSRLRGRNVVLGGDASAWSETLIGLDHSESFGLDT